MKINVSIEVPEWEAGDDEDGIPSHAGLPGQIIHEAARQVLAGRIDYNKPDIRAACIAEVQKQITAQAEPLVAEAVKDALAGVLRPTNEYGEPVGDPTTLRKVIVKQAEKYLAEKVNDRGEHSGYYGSGRDQAAVPRVEWMIRNAVAATIKGEMDAELKKAAAEVRAQLTGNMTKLMAESVTKLLGVNGAS